MGDDIEILQGVMVFDVAADGPDLYVDIYGGSANVCGSVRFTFTDRGQRREAVELMARWRRERTPLTFVSTGSTISLQNDLALFGSH